MAVAGEAAMQAVGSAGLGGRGSAANGELRGAHEMNPGRGANAGVSSPRAERAVQCAQRTCK